MSDLLNAFALILRGCGPQRCFDESPLVPGPPRDLPSFRHCRQAGASVSSVAEVMRPKQISREQGQGRQACAPYVCPGKENPVLDQPAVRCVANSLRVKLALSASLTAQHSLFG